MPSATPRKTAAKEVAETPVAAKKAAAPRKVAAKPTPKQIKDVPAEPVAATEEA